MSISAGGQHSLLTAISPEVLPLFESLPEGGEQVAFEHRWIGNRYRKLQVFSTIPALWVYQALMS